METTAATTTTTFPMVARPMLLPPTSPSSASSLRCSLCCCCCCCLSDCSYRKPFFKKKIKRAGMRVQRYRVHAGGKWTDRSSSSYEKKRNSRRRCLLNRRGDGSSTAAYAGWTSTEWLQSKVQGAGLSGATFLMNHPLSRGRRTASRKT